MDDAEITHNEIVERVAAAEGLRPETIEPLVGSETRAQVGEVATLGGMNIDKAIGVELELADGRDPRWTRTFHVFARTNSLVPHLAVEWFGSGDGTDARVSVLVDLLPRIDLAVNLDYVDEVYGPLTGAHSDVRDVPDIVIERIPPRRAIAMSPWRLAVSVPAERVTDLVPSIDRYIDRWLAVNSGGVGSTVDPLASDPSRLVQHDRFHRSTLFDAASDPFWERIDRLLGLDRAAELRLTLRSQRER